MAGLVLKELLYSRLNRPVARLCLTVQVGNAVISSLENLRDNLPINQLVVNHIVSVPRSTQPSTLRGTVNEYQPHG